MSSSNLKYGFYALVTVLLGHLLSGCTESTNIAASGSAGVSSCGSLIDANCVAGRFIDEAVENLDYECGLAGVGTVRSKTEIDGSFSCPNNSVAIFSLVNPDDPDQKIILGEVKIKRPADIYADASPSGPAEEEATPSLYFYVTPYSLAGGVNKQTSDQRALNIARLLQTMNTDPTSANLASRRIIISNDDKRLIVSSLFDENIDDIFVLDPAPDGDLAEPDEGTFDKAIENFLDEIGKSQLISSADAAVTLGKGVYSTFAGAYASTPSILVTGTQSDADLGNMIGYGTGADANKRFLGQFWVVVDRRGRMIGSGMYSYGAQSTTTSMASDPQAMDLFGFGASGDQTWPYQGDLTGLLFSLRGSSDSGKSVRITQGVMSRGAIVSSDRIHRNLFGEGAEGVELGEWNLEGGSTIYIAGAPYTLEHTTPASTLMNPDLWESADFDFPIPLQVSIFNYDAAGCPSTKGCEIANLRLLILEDGNIVSDINNKCGVGLDPATLQYSSSGQEYPLGVVSNIIRGDAPESIVRDENGDPITVMTLLAMLPNNSNLISAFANPGFEQYFPYIQFASNFGLNSLLRVDAAGGDQYQMYGRCSSEFITPLGMCDALGRFEPGIAEWINYYTSARLQYAFDKGQPTTALSNNSAGFMRSSFRTCP